MAKSVLVTGATGFIGSRLVNELINKGYEVTSLIRQGKEGNLKSKIVYGDLTDDTIDFEGMKFDCVFHLASHTPLEKNRKKLEKVNLEGTKKLFNEIKSNPSKVLRKSVKGMLPKNKLSEKLINRLKVYSGSKHPHCSQLSNRSLNDN